MFYFVIVNACHKKWNSHFTSHVFARRRMSCYEFYEHAPEVYLGALAAVFNRMMSGEVFEETYRCALITPIHKRVRPTMWGITGGYLLWILSRRFLRGCY